MAMAGTNGPLSRALLAAHCAHGGRCNRPNRLELSAATWLLHAAPGAAAECPAVASLSGQLLLNLLPTIGASVRARAPQAAAAARGRVQVRQRRRASLPATQLLLQRQHLRLLLRRQQLYLLGRERHDLLQQSCRAGDTQGRGGGVVGWPPARSDPSRRAPAVTRAAFTAHQQPRGAKERHPPCCCSCERLPAGAGAACCCMGGGAMAGGACCACCGGMACMGARPPMRRGSAGCCACGGGPPNPGAPGCCCGGPIGSGGM